jgi:hypothetical protein
LPFDLAPASLSVSRLGFAGFGFLAVGSSEKVATERDGTANCTPKDGVLGLDFFR